jgi:hypothetical protein
VFKFTTGDSGTTAGALDQIKDWLSSDRIVFNAGSAPASSANYIEFSASDYTSALSLANSTVGGAAIHFVAIQIGSDVVVFSDPGGTGSVHDAITLVGKSLADIDSSNITFS